MFQVVEHDSGSTIPAAENVSLSGTCFRQFLKSILGSGTSHRQRNMLQTAKSVSDSGTYFNQRFKFKDRFMQ
jgi:hypothetical protein